MNTKLTVDVAPTVETIRMMATRARQAAEELDSIADKMVARSDITYTAEAVNTIMSMLLNSRLDLLVTRPIRALGC